MNDTPDIIVLHAPRGGSALPVMRVIMGGMASRHDLPLDRLDDLQLAVETILAEEPAAGPDFVLRLSMRGDELGVTLEGLENQSVKAALLATDPFKPCRGCLLDVRLFLDALVDRYQVLESGAGSFAVDMAKRTA